MRKCHLINGSSGSGRRRRTNPSNCRFVVGCAYYLQHTDSSQAALFIYRCLKIRQQHLYAKYSACNSHCNILLLTHANRACLFFFIHLNCVRPLLPPFCAHCILLLLLRFALFFCANSPYLPPPSLCPLSLLCSLHAPECVPLVINDVTYGKWNGRRRHRSSLHYGSGYGISFPYNLFFSLSSYFCMFIASRIYAMKFTMATTTPDERKKTFFICPIHTRTMNGEARTNASSSECAQTNLVRMRQYFEYAFICIGWSYEENIANNWSSHGRLNAA